MLVTVRYCLQQRPMRLPNIINRLQIGVLGRQHAQLSSSITTSGRARSQLPPVGATASDRPDRRCHAGLCCKLQTGGRARRQARHGRRLTGCRTLPPPPPFVCVAPPCQSTLRQRSVGKAVWSVSVCAAKSAVGQPPGLLGVFLICIALVHVCGPRMCARMQEGSVWRGG